MAKTMRIRQTVNFPAEVTETVQITRKVTPRSCKWCGILFGAVGKRVYHSELCSTEHERAKMREYNEEKKAKKLAKRKVRCKNCSAIFSPVHANTWYCKDECKSMAAARSLTKYRGKARERVEARKRIARLREENMSLQERIERRREAMCAKEQGQS